MLTAASIQAQNTTLLKHYLQAGKFYATSKKDMESAFKFLVVDEDTQVVTQMVMEGKVSLPTKEQQEIFITSSAADLLLSDYLEFRFKGQSTKYWTLREWIDKPNPDNLPVEGD